MAYYRPSSVTRTPSEKFIFLRCRYSLIAQRGCTFNRTTFCGTTITEHRDRSPANFNSPAGQGEFKMVFTVRKLQPPTAIVVVVVHTFVSLPRGRAFDFRREKRELFIMIEERDRSLRSSLARCETPLEVVILLLPFALPPPFSSFFRPLAEETLQFVIQGARARRVHVEALTRSMELG